MTCGAAMLERMKKWNWRLICSISLLAVYFIGFIGCEALLSSPEYEFLLADGYEPTVEVFGGMALVFWALFFVRMIIQVWHILDVVFPPKIKE